MNKHRQRICAIYSYGCQESTFELPRNPTVASNRRREPERARLEFFSPQQVEALADALSHGAHRDSRAPGVDEDERIARAADDRQDGELVRVAAYTGLRRGELVALRWRDIDFELHKIVVRRAISANVEASSTKSRRAREAPLAGQAADALQRLAERSDFTAPDDFVFCNRLGRRLDGFALRRRVERGRDAAKAPPAALPRSADTPTDRYLLVAGGVDLVSVKAAMGHSRITTTERYLHARSAGELADKFTQALAASEARSPTSRAA